PADPLAGRAHGRARPARAPLAVGTDPRPAGRIRPHSAPDDALRRGGRAVRSRCRVGSWPARRPRHAGRAQAGGGRRLARGGVPRAHRPSPGRDGRRVSMRAVYGIVAREFVRFLRQRGRVLASIGRPFVWLVFAGGGFAAVFAGRNEIDYRVYMAPGLLGMVVMFGSLLAALSTVTDREAGVLRMVLVAPIRRSTVAFGKALGATLLGTAQAIVVAAILLPCVQLRPTLAGILLGLVALVLSGLALGALGVVLAASIRSIENFAGVMNFVVFPMLFLSGALYPVRHLGPVLRTLAYVHPRAHGVDLLKHALLSHWAGAGYGGELPAPLDCAALVLFAIVGLAVA